MGVKENSEIMERLKATPGEQIVFSCNVLKFNRWGMRQDRTLLLTNQNLYNIKKS